MPSSFFASILLLTPSLFTSPSPSAVVADNAQKYENRF
jgi:hypothetical protein